MVVNETSHSDHSWSVSMYLHPINPIAEGTKVQSGFAIQTNLQREQGPHEACPLDIHKLLSR